MCMYCNKQSCQQFQYLDAFTPACILIKPVLHWVRELGTTRSVDHWAIQMILPRATSLIFIDAGPIMSASFININVVFHQLLLSWAASQGSKGWQFYLMNQNECIQLKFLLKFQWWTIEGCCEYWVEYLRAAYANKL